MGRFLLQNQGSNGYWTHYFLTYPWTGQKTGKNNRGELFSDLEHFILERSPIILATQERFRLFLQENQKAVANDATLACVPCGMMGELLYLDINNSDRVQVIGLDYDPETLNDARKLAEKQNKTDCTTLIQKDAWHINWKNEIDLISSNGLTIYEPSNERVIQLYQRFYDALKPGGKLVTSFLTSPPNLTDDCEWVTENINQEDLLLQRILFIDVIDVAWQCFRSTQETSNQLASVGFKDITFIYDKAHIFPTVTAIK